jgi:hypothetical protein
MEKQNNIVAAIVYSLIGIVLGCLIMYIAHSEMYHHYNVCQEQQLLDSIAEMKTEKNWYIKEDSTGKIRVVEMSNAELDSLTQTTK